MGMPTTTYKATYAPTTTYKEYYTTEPWYTPKRYRDPSVHENVEPAPLPPNLKYFNPEIKTPSWTQPPEVPYKPYSPPTFAPVPTVKQLPYYNKDIPRDPHDPRIPYRDPAKKPDKPNVPYKHYWPTYTTKYYYTTTTPYTTTTYTTTGWETTTTTTGWGEQTTKYEEPKYEEPK